MLLTLLAKRTTGVLRGIKPAPPRFALKMFGGSMTIEEFRNIPDNICYCILPKNLIIQPITVTEVRENDKKNDRDNIPIRWDNTEPVINEPLRLQRPKNIKNKRDTNSIKKAMGIFTT